MEPPRKKIRRVVNSCLECRRRKIRCDLSSNASDICTACAARGIACEKWEHSSDAPDSYNLELSARLRRVESLLEKLTDVESLDAVEAALNVGSGDGSITAPIEGHNHPPLISLFDNAVFGHQEQSTPSSGPEYRSPSQVSGIPHNAKLEKLRLVLSALLPTQDDADLIAASTNAWGLGQLLYAATERSTKADLEIATLSKGSPLTIARTLMHFAILIQQLPPEFDTSRLQFNSPIETVLQKYLYYVADLVTSKDDFACTMEGLECLLLQSLFYINDGNLRRAWLAARRALYTAQFLGLQKSYLSCIRNSDGDGASHRANAMMWTRTVMLDRFLAPILGLPCGAGSDCFGEDGTMVPIIDFIDVFERRLCVIAGLIAARNQKDPAPGYTTTLDIDEKLEKLAKDMGDMLTKIPTLHTPHPSPADEDSFKLVMSQIWFYQITIILHIPWMLRAFTDSKFEYSRFACLNASREHLRRYLALRDTNNTQNTARIVDFGTVIAAVTLILNRVESATRDTATSDGDSDMKLVSKVVESMRTVSRGPREFMARQGVEVMEALLELKNGNRDRDTSDTLRFTIPFFGPIVISRSNTPAGATPAAIAQNTLNADDPIESLLLLNGAQSGPNFSGILNGPVHGHHLSFEQAKVPDSGWVPPLEAWDFDTIPDWGDSFSLWDVPGWNTNSQNPV
ncbi:uncharacterized protein Z519_08071 [Cladophialophora bantiana CBS 173.52]|uniref:Zn(2)-C6 fungal-type domain-containing protein n=1 Tax=Cladophialophora bantiana (strain ATCC 10958 / CBS 173.52 / CDC B-1940 / NIH 8579) TaxID=1442370 RepID=A0A0D2EMC4_CLAB1|nr:uncharacterized protein Z519_08071 [Cladophialophora bantiana CBS 173.52]KIW91176.1 hypothetical protein Z519_08071 [Cladophialophora bantiana CBS 173.52]